MQRTNKVLRKPWIIVLGVIFIAMLLASRLINLDKTSRFIWDESSDLVNIHEIYIDHKLTLVGPISEDGSKVFSSLTYYMLLPFAIAGNFDPASTAYGAAFWGILTGILVAYLIYQTNRKIIFLVLPIIVFWFPFVEIGRWAWNPNLIPFFSVLTLIFLIKDQKIFKFLAGIAIGLTVHLHYVAMFSAIGIWIYGFIDAIRQRKISNFFLFGFGFFLTIVPFVIFDIMHSPGLFLSRIIYFNNLGPSVNFPTHLWQVINESFIYFTQSPILSVILGALVIFLFIYDLKNSRKNLWLIGIFIVQSLGLIFVANYYSHYILPALVPFLYYIIIPRKNFGKFFSILCASIILLSAFFSFPKQISKVTWETNISATRYITNTIADFINSQDIKNNNIAVIASQDPNLYGRRYRDLLLIRNIKILTKDEYNISDHLFVITEASINTVREDRAFEMNLFRKGPLVSSWDVPKSSWKIYLFSRSPI